MIFARFFRQALILPLMAILFSACTTLPSDTDSQDTPALPTASVDKTTTQTSTIDPAIEASYKKALQTLQQGNRSEAVRLLTELNKRAPGLSGPATNLGLIYLADGDLDKAESALQQAISMNSRNAVAYNHLGIIYRQRGQFEQALGAYQKALSIDPRYANAHLNLAILYELYLIKLNDALRHYQQYQSLQAQEDAQVKKWIAGLQHRAKRSK